MSIKALKTSLKNFFRIKIDNFLSLGLLSKLVGVMGLCLKYAISLIIYKYAVRWLACVWKVFERCSQQTLRRPLRADYLEM